MLSVLHLFFTLRKYIFLNWIYQKAKSLCLKVELKEFSYLKLFFLNLCYLQTLVILFTLSIFASVTVSSSKLSIESFSRLQISGSQISGFQPSACQWRHGCRHNSWCYAKCIAEIILNNFCEILKGVCIIRFGGSKTDVFITSRSIITLL